MSQLGSASPAPAQLLAGGSVPAVAVASFGDLGSADATAAMVAAAAAHAQVVERHSKLPEGTDGPPVSLEVFSELARWACEGVALHFSGCALCHTRYHLLALASRRHQCPSKSVVICSRMHLRMQPLA